MKIFKNGEFAEDYNGPRETGMSKTKVWLLKTIPLFWLDGIISTMRSKAGPSYRVLESLADYEKFLEHNDHSIIGMFYRI